MIATATRTMHSLFTDLVNDQGRNKVHDDQHKIFLDMAVSSNMLRAAVDGRHGLDKPSKSRSDIDGLKGEVDSVEFETTQAVKETARDHRGLFSGYRSDPTGKDKDIQLFSQGLETPGGSQSTAASHTEQLKAQMEKRLGKVIGDVTDARAENYDDRKSLVADEDKLMNLFLSGARLTPIEQKTLYEIRRTLAEAKRRDDELGTLQNTTLRTGAKQSQLHTESALEKPADDSSFVRDPQYASPDSLANFSFAFPATQNYGFAA